MVTKPFSTIFRDSMYTRDLVYDNAASEFPDATPFVVTTMVASLLDALPVELKLQVMINMDFKSLLRFVSVCGKHDHPSSQIHVFRFPGHCTSYSAHLRCSST